MKFSGAILFIVLLMSSGCGVRVKSLPKRPQNYPSFGEEAPQENSAGPTAEVESINSPVSSKPLREMADRILNHQNIDECGRNNRDKILEIVDALDLRKQDIDAFNAQQASLNSSNFVYWNPIRLRDNLGVRHNAHSIDEFFISWSNLYQVFLRIRNSPVDVNWGHLNRLAISTLGDDTFRILQGYTYDLEYSSKPKLLRLREAVNNCLLDQSCVDIHLDPDLENFAQSLRSLKPSLEYFRILQNDTVNRRRELSSILAWVDHYLARFKFKQNPTIRRENNTLILPLDAGPFEQSKHLFKELIENFWKWESTTNPIRVEIEWKSSIELPQIFGFRFGTQNGARAFVSYNEQTVTLFNYSSLKIIVHEIGHVLGFPDAYFTSWHEDQCRYKFHVDSRDVMSDNDHGELQEFHASELRRNY